MTRPARGAARGGDRAGAAGFTLTEVLVAIALLAIVAVALVTGLALSGELVGRSRADQVAVNLAAAEIERARALPYRDLGTYVSAGVQGNPPGIIPQRRTERRGDVDYLVETQVAYVDDPAPGQSATRLDYKRVAVTVTPQAHGGEPVTLATVVAPPAAGSSAGSVTVIPRALDVLTAQPVAGARLTVGGAVSPPRSDAADARGEAVFADLPPGAADPADPAYNHTVTVSAEGYVATAASGPDVVRQHLTAGQSWSPTLNVFRPVTIVVDVRDAATGAAVTRRSDVRVVAPQSESLVAEGSGTAGSHAFTQMGGRPIEPSRSSFTVVAHADCYGGAVLQGPAPEGYPSQLTQTFEARLQPATATGTLRVRVVDAATGAPVAGARARVSGGDGPIVPWERPLDGSASTDYCLAAATAPYVAEATAPGYGLGSLRVAVGSGAAAEAELRLVAGPTGDLRLLATPGRYVRLRASAGTVDIQETADAAGQVSVRGLAAGGYVAQTSADGVTWGAEQPVTVVAGQVVQATLT